MIKLHVEEIIGQEIEVDIPAFEWLVEHAADLITRYQTGKDGKTPFQRLRGKNATGEIYTFGSRVMARAAGKTIGGLMAERWFQAIWLGVRSSSGEHLVAHLAEGTVFRCRSVQGTGKLATYEELKNIKGRPWAPTGTMSMTQKSAVRTEGGDGVSDGSAPHHFIPRSMRFTRAVLEKVGYTEGCSKCRAVARGGPIREATLPSAGKS